MGVAKRLFLSCSLTCTIIGLYSYFNIYPIAMLVIGLLFLIIAGIAQWKQFVNWIDDNF